MIYEDNRLYACLAKYPLVKGHTVIVWKRKARDLHVLSKREYEYLMDKVDVIRNAMLEALGIDKVYLVYMDETHQVHWHLIPRYNKKGFALFEKKPKKTKDFSLAKKISDKITQVGNTKK